MSKIMHLISKQLGNKSDWLIKDVSNVIGLKRCFESSGLIRVLENLGWEERPLDYRTLELICFYLENRIVPTRRDLAYQRL